MSETTVTFQEQFESAAQQREAAMLGMWIFLCTEILLFGALFLAYTVYRLQNPEAFDEATRHTLIVLGSINTAILLISSFFVAVAVHLAPSGRRRPLALLLWTGALLGVLFLVVKGFEYHHEIADGLFPGPGFHFPGHAPREVEMFFVLYFTMTGLHALHVAIGVLLLAGYGVAALLVRDPSRLATAIDLTGLYWHFVDLVWVFLFPLFYLAGRQA
jgi:cytochrome c oxidase subunit 3